MISFKLANLIGNLIGFYAVRTVLLIEPFVWSPLEDVSAPTNNNYRSISFVGIIIPANKIDKIFGQVKTVHFMNLLLDDHIHRWCFHSNRCISNENISNYLYFFENCQFGRCIGKISSVKCDKWVTLWRANLLNTICCHGLIL